ncbi:MAG: mandelate racemase/muconate lactonizing enzyme family protein [Alphaproteobacteria bacterium]|nr:mandelate racemase/muconate lactonizing enzyme family protein [Alphaproteobacteria bacterium]
MKIVALETLRLEEFPNLLWLQIVTDRGLIGLGESFFVVAPTEAWLHANAAPLLLGQDPRRVEALSRTLRLGYVGYASSGAEMRGASAVDMALWDILGQIAGMPIHQLLGGLGRERIRVYNTCAGYRYVRNRVGQRTDNWGLDRAEGPYEDLDAFLNRADELALSLLEQGITAMKIWPFDFAAEATGGLDISPGELDRALEPFRKIRRAAGERMDIMVELHALWTLPAARKIVAAVEPFKPYWIEDPVRANNLDAWAQLAGETRVPLCGSETLATRFSFREAMAKRAIGIVMPDIAWCGGITEGKAIAAMAEAHHLPFAPHDCTGPLGLISGLHLSLNAPNGLIQETVRAFYAGWYKELVTELPRIEGGFAYPMTGAGLGTKLIPDLWKRKDATVRCSAA